MNWHVDGGHSWLEVSESNLKSLGIDNKISSFSYKKGDKVYLEEDCDAPLFFESYFKDKEWYKKQSIISQFKSIPETVYKGDAPVRNYSRYNPSGYVNN